MEIPETQEKCCYRRPTETDIFSHILDELLGRNRNGEYSESDDIKRFDDPRVCKYDLAGLCPYQLYTNTRSDLGPCPYACCPVPEHLVLQYEKSRRFGMCGYEIELEELLSRLVRRCDSRARSLRKKIQDERKSNKQPKEIVQIDNEIFQVLKEAEKMGEESKVTESQRLLEKVEELKKKKTAMQEKISKILVKEQDLIVCKDCGAKLSLNDSAQRLTAHYKGKLHIGFLKVRRKLAELTEIRRTGMKPLPRLLSSKSKINQEKENEKSRNKERERERGRGREKNRESNREREREREKEKDKEMNIEKDKKRERAKYRERERGRDREKNRDRNKEREREREREKNPRNKERERDRDRKREKRSTREKKRENHERERDREHHKERESKRNKERESNHKDRKREEGEIIETRKRKNQISDQNEIKVEKELSHQKSRRLLEEGEITEKSDSNLKNETSETEEGEIVEKN
ncbi:RNA-binding protein luc7-related [Anaeramoeba flamelloides]|uniref:RNA-binding protein luc7-related n=1 Tax=Anaeramoeba flamelloides TaxID=1746091 RepID=A0AAV7ZNJ1_9EUKA|nr:RNA-binding protein luc7-related [Anaeramoeba flamelloides]